jgi:hypothetical protein
MRGWAKVAIYADFRSSDFNYGPPQFAHEAAAAFQSGKGSRAGQCEQMK